MIPIRRIYDTSKGYTCFPSFIPPGNEQGLIYTQWVPFQSGYIFKTLVIAQDIVTIHDCIINPSLI